MTATNTRSATSVLVSGPVGRLQAAIELAERGADVLAVGKRATEEATDAGCGGINAPRLRWTRMHLAAERGRHSKRAISWGSRERADRDQNAAPAYDLNATECLSRASRRRISFGNR